MRALFLILVALLALQIARHWGDKPQLAIDPTPAKAPAWADVWKAPPMFCPAPLPVCQHGVDCPAPVTRRA